MITFAEDGPDDQKASIDDATIELLRKALGPKKRGRWVFRYADKPCIELGTTKRVAERLNADDVCVAHIDAFADWSYLILLPYIGADMLPLLHRTGEWTEMMRCVTTAIDAALGDDV